MQPVVVNDGITQRIKDLLEQNMDKLTPLWVTYEPGPATQGQEPTQGKEFNVYIELQDQLLYTPAIEIVEKDTDTEIFSIGTQEDRFNYSSAP